MRPTSAPAPGLPLGPAIVGSALLSAFTVAGKSARDALFCAYFPAAELPKTMLAGAALSALAALLTSRVFRRRGPAAVLPPLLVLNALGFLAQHAAFPVAPRAVAMLLYLHVSAVTGLIASGFWSVVNERFDPHALRRSISRIGLGGTVGGFIGGVTAERLASWAGARHGLIELALVSLLAALSIAGLRPPVAAEPAAEAPSGPVASSYLFEIGAFVGLTALTSSLVDFAFKAGAMGRYSSPEALMQFFALFYTGTSLLSFCVQGFVTPRLLDRAGLGVGLAALPAALSSSALLALALPGSWTQGVLRAADGSLIPSLYRSAYEPLYTPVAAARKRSVKAVIDVLVNRAGDAFGSLLSWGLVLALPAAAGTGANVLVALAAVLTLFLSQRLRRGYIAELAASLRSGVVVLDESGVQDQTTRLTLSQTLSDLNRERLLREINALRARAESPPAPPGAPPANTPAGTAPASAATGPVTAAGALPAGAPSSEANRERAERLSQALLDLSSSDVERVRRALADPDPELAPFVIPLLGRADLGAQAMNVLSGFGTRVVGQLGDALLDAERHSPAVRRRLVRVIATAQSAWAAAALGAALEDPDFDVRRQVVRGLEELALHGVHLPIERHALLAAAARELDARPDIANEERVDHALRLLGLAFDREAFRLARGALEGTDLKLRGTALEYLDNVLPASLKHALFQLLPEQRSERTQRESHELIDELRQSGLFSH